MFRSQTTAPLYLGVLAVVPRVDLKRHLEFAWSKEDVGGALRAHLEECMSLPKAPATADAKSLALDVFVSGYQLGELYDVGPEDFALPLAWRPKIEISARLYRLKDREELHTFYISKAARWSTYLSRLFSWRHMFGLSTLFRADDMKQLLDEALIELLEKVRAKT